MMSDFISWLFAAKCFYFIYLNLLFANDRTIAVL